MDLPTPQFPIPVPVRPQLADQGSLNVRVSGGDTQIEVVWETLLAASSHVGAARDIAGRQQDDISANNTLFLVPRPQIPHWRAPVLASRSAALSVRLILISGLVEKCVAGIEHAHGTYRDGESVIRRWMQISELLAETSYIIDQVQQGDGRVAGDWARSLGVLGGQEALRLLAAYFTRGRSGLVDGRSSGRDRAEDGAGFGYLAISKLEEEDLLAEFEMGRHELRLGERTATISHQGDGTLHSWYEQMEQVPEAGDVAVTTVTDETGGTTYLVHLPGLDMDITDLNRDDGRGYLGLVDSAFNDADQLADVVDEALATVGAEEGDQIALSGYSLGGIGVTNLVRNGRLGEKYDLAAATSIGAPGRHGSFPPGTQTSTTHIQDRRDPVPHLLGEHQGTGVNRQVIEVSHDDADARPDEHSLFGDAHSYQHYLDIVEELEADPDTHLGDGGDALLRDFSSLYQGEAETHIFRTGWSENEDGSTTDLLDPEFWEDSGLTDAVRESYERLDPLGLRDVFGPVTPVDQPAPADSDSVMKETPSPGDLPADMEEDEAHGEASGDTGGDARPLAHTAGWASADGLSGLGESEASVPPPSEHTQQAQPLTPGVIGTPGARPGTPTDTWSEVEMPVHVHEDPSWDSEGAHETLGGGRADVAGMPQHRGTTVPAEDPEPPVRLTPGEVTVPQPLTPAVIGPR